MTLQNLPVLISLLVAKYRFIVFAAISTSAVLILVVFGMMPSQDSIQVKILRGEATLVQRRSDKDLDTHQQHAFSQGNVLQVPEDSAVLLIFTSGRTLTITDESELEFISTKNTNSERIYLFEDKLTGEAFSYNEHNGLHRANAAVLSSSSSEIDPRVLGIYDERIELIAECVLDQAYTEENVVENCKQKYGLNEL
jgi:hypothetical protein